MTRSKIIFLSALASLLALGPTKAQNFAQQLIIPLQEPILAQQQQIKWQIEQRGMQQQPAKPAKAKSS
jgi:hypothetical protein